jgi:hypothetical protein
MLDEQDITCPYCGELIDAFIDPSAGSQAYIEDCSVCCRPIEIRVEVDNEGNVLGISAERDDE